MDDLKPIVVEPRSNLILIHELIHELMDTAADPARSGTGRPIRDQRFHQ